MCKYTVNGISISNVWNIRSSFLDVFNKHIPNVLRKHSFCTKSKKLKS